MSTVDSPLGPGGLTGFGRRLRSGEITARQVTDACLARIEAHDPKLGAFVHVAAAEARDAAHGIDRLLAAGTDLGPLMGVPVAVKDLFAVHGMPTQAGSELDVSDAIGAEGPFVRALKRAGCIVLGKTRTIEFAAGAHNVRHPTPWNPCDPNVKRTPGGSSSGSAVAVAAGLCGFAVGSDTGGSVRVPAALCGVFGLKTSTGLWPLDGVFPLCPDLDSVGLITAGPEDAAVVYHALTGEGAAAPHGLTGLRFGFAPPAPLALEAGVARRYEAALDTLGRAGVDLVPVHWPDAEEAEAIAAYFSQVVATDLLATIGRDRLARFGDRIDPVAMKRLAAALNVRASEYVSLRRRQHTLARAAGARLQGLDGVLSPTAPIPPCPVAEIADADAAVDFVAEALRISRAANVYDLCAASIPVPVQPGEGPAGLQLAARHGSDHRLIGDAMAVQQALQRA